jgi:putative SOS response-associated peptidase YedK
MCYDIKASLEAQLNRARRNNDEKAIREIIEKLLPLTDVPIFHASGFSHPKLFIYTDAEPNLPTPAAWGLIPHWVRDTEQQQKIWNNTLNARGESIFEKPSFRDAARHNRCLIYIDGFYEHHHFNGKTYPFHIKAKKGEPLVLAGLWSVWNNPETGEVLHTFTIVTTEGNSLLGKIHNNPKLEGPRMPLILPSELEDDWLQPIEDELDIKQIQQLIGSYPSEWLEAYPVRRLRGKQYLGNVPESAEPFEYEELEF